jgi:hypothetical protein
VSKGLNVPENITLLPLPLYPLELNPIERLWSWLNCTNSVTGCTPTTTIYSQSGVRAWNTLTPDRLRTVCHTGWIEREE